MEKIFGDFIQNKNVLMFTSAIAYIMGLYAYFTDKPILFAGIFTSVVVILLLKNFPLKIASVWIIIFYFAFFNASLRITNTDDLFKLAPVDCKIYGQVVSIPNSNIPNNSKFFFNVQKVECNNKIYNLNNKTLVNMTVARDFSISDNISVGEYYELKGKLSKPFQATNPSQFSYGNYLRNFKTYTVFYATDVGVKHIAQNLTLKWKVVKYLNDKRNDILKTHSTYLKSPNLEILGGVVFGDDAVAPPDYVKTSFINSGLLHILAASGMNVAFISGFLFFFLRRFGVPYNIRIISGILVIILYSLMTGLGASVIRAALMLIFILLGKLIDRDAHSVALLSFVGLLMLIYNPAYINDVGFQLSFIVTFGILVSANAVMKYTKRIPLWLAGEIFIPIIAQLWVIPIQMFYFNTISTYSIFANIASMPFLSVISFGGFISSVFSLFEPIADFICHWFDFILNPMLNALVWISNFFAGLPNSLFITTHPSILQVLLYYVILSAFVVLLHIEFKNKKLILSTIIMSFVLLISAVLHLPNHKFEVIAFEVGNADMFLLKTPQNKYFVVDTGRLGYKGRRSQADIIMLKYLKDKGIKDIEGLIITHFDSDHAGGAVDLIQNLKIKHVYMNSLSDKKRLASNIYTVIDKNVYTDMVDAKNNTLIYSEKDGFTIKTFRANVSNKNGDLSENENSVITLVQFGKMSMLFTGDSGVRAFELLKHELPQDITVLKVGHHGAKNVVNKEMLDYLNPEISLVSVGFNKYGHPCPLTIKLLSKTKLVRTDKINSIRIVANQKGYEVDGFDSKSHKYYKKYSRKF
ncbi:MAG: DNA internalization-related competence protein ComEC/Rec2 [Candidatus Gastranaerophilales bacterium]|nr:DNA internalization-related competence protein ComEC/Rec2 [Candidatus Gastranaerophilales bacterium]